LWPLFAFSFSFSWINLVGPSFEPYPRMRMYGDDLKEPMVS